MQLRHFSRILGIALVCFTGSIARSAIVVSEDFESYTSTADMQAVWGSTGLGTLNTGLGNPGNSASHAGGAVNSIGGFSLTPSATLALVLTADIFDDGTSTNERMTVGLRNGANPLFEMGHNNNPLGHYQVRVLNMYGNEGWTPISPGLLASSGQPAGWNRYQATFTATSLTVTLDLGADGTIDGTFVSFGAPSANPFVDLRFGGASGLSSAGGGVSFDNISLQTVAVPEPSSAGLLLAGCLGLITQVRRRRS